jgi:hypothetical protein
VKQDILLTEGERDHLFDVDWLYQAMRELVSAHSVTARIFTAREGGEQHCQVGRSLNDTDGSGRIRPLVLAVPFIVQEAC